MKALLTAKVGMFLVVSSVLAIWTLLAAGPGMAHEKGGVALLSPSCSTIPDDTSAPSDGLFFTGTQVRAISAATPAPTGLKTKRGVGTTNQRRGDQKFHYAKITIPALAAGELRVFDLTAAGGETDTGDDATTHKTPSDAILCRKGSQIASSRKSYTSAHRSAEAAASRATDAATKAADFDASAATTTAFSALDLNTATQTQQDAAKARDANTDVSAARSALTAARSALTTVASALTAASRTVLTDADRNTLTGAATTATDAADELADALAEPNLTTASSTATSDKTTAVRSAKDELRASDGAAKDLRGAATALTTEADKEHSGFRLRAPVSPGDEEYVVVVALPNTTVSPMPAMATSTELTLNVAFHGAIDNADSAQDIKGTLNPRAVDSYMIEVTAPGLLTLGTTGSTDTIGILESGAAQVAYAESGGSGGNFETSVPVSDADYTVKVEGQTLQTNGDYTLDMAFKVAMSTVSAFTATGATNNSFAWSTNPVAADDTTVQIKKVNEGSADEDYFLLTPANSGRLTVKANNDADGSTKDADTIGTLFGAMETGPMMEMRAGQIAMDSDSGPGNHFQFTVPVEGENNYLVKVTGTDGFYKLEFGFAQVEHTGPTVSPTGPISTPNPLPADGRHLYLLNVSESGALYLHTTGRTDVVGTLYGPDGTEIALDSNSGEGGNFRIATNVESGLYLLEVTGVDKDETGPYGLVSNFVTGDVVEGPTTPTTPTTPGTDAPDADPTGVLDEPADGGARSGIGLVRGWVCQDAGAGVEIRITGPSGSNSQTRTITAPYGSDRGDVGVDDLCEDQTTTNVGFAIQYNYNLLPAGMYEIEAFVGTEQIGQTAAGQTNTFDVVRISSQQFLEGASSGDVRVPDFPGTGDTTILEWDEQSQNFQIVDTE